MGDQIYHDLVALQLNVSPGTDKAKGSASKRCSQFLIKEYIRQSDPHRLPDPTFVALQDGITVHDCKNIASAFRERRGFTDGDLLEASTKSKGVSLLYDRNSLVEVKDSEWKLEKDDFFASDERKRKAAQLDERIAGGLFQHRKSTQFIVAISYHGRLKTKSEEAAVQRKEYVRELLNVLEKKYARRKPLYIVLGDFNLYIEKADLPVGWDQQQIDRNTARNLRSRRPLDHVLTNGFAEAEKFAREFSPLPLTLGGDDGTVSYGFSNAANLLFDGRKAISREDLEHISLNNLDTTLLDEFETKQSFFIGDLPDTKRTFDHDFIFFHARIQDSENVIVDKKEREKREATPSKPRSPRRNREEAKMHKSAIKIVSHLCQDQNWREKIVNGTDAEWLEFTNRLIQQYDLDLTNVREVLLHLGPKQSTPEPDSGTVDSYRKTVKQEKDI